MFSQQASTFPSFTNEWMTFGGTATATQSSAQAPPRTGAPPRPADRRDLRADRLVVDVQLARSGHDPAVLGGAVDTAPPAVPARAGTAGASPPVTRRWC